MMLIKQYYKKDIKNKKKDKERQGIKVLLMGISPNFDWQSRPFQIMSSKLSQIAFTLHQYLS